MWGREAVEIRKAGSPGHQRGAQWVGSTWKRSVGKRHLRARARWGGPRVQRRFRAARVFYAGCTAWAWARGGFDEREGEQSKQSPRASCSAGAHTPCPPPRTPPASVAGVASYHVEPHAGFALFSAHRKCIEHARAFLSAPTPAVRRAHARTRTKSAAPRRVGLPDQASRLCRVRVVVQHWAFSESHLFLFVASSNIHRQVMRNLDFIYPNGVKRMCERCLNEEV